MSSPKECGACPECIREAFLRGVRAGLERGASYLDTAGYKASGVPEYGHHANAIRAINPEEVQE